jgi:hypothetical protein
MCSMRLGSSTCISFSASLWRMYGSPTLCRVLSTRNVGFSLCDHTRVLTVSSETHLLQYSPFLKATFVIDRVRHNHFKLRSHSTFSPLYSCLKALSSFATLNSSSTATLNLLLLLDTSLTVSVGGLLCLTLVCYLHWPYFNQFSV